MTEPKDYKNRSYLSAIEAARYLNMSVEVLHGLAKRDVIPSSVSTSGQMRFSLDDLVKYESTKKTACTESREKLAGRNEIRINETIQEVIVENSQSMRDLEDNSIHLMLTSPPYFDAKMYSKVPVDGDLGNIHSVDNWFDEIGKVWSESFRVLQPGRKAFINIMNLPIRLDDGGFKTLNLAGRTVDLCERIGFSFKRDIIWHKTNAARAHFGTYPYPGGILLNNMHEFILEFEKPAPKGYKKYDHLTKEQKEKSKIGKEFWLSLKNSDVWLMAPEGSGDRRNHVAPFPYELPYRLIKAFTYISETVLDPFVGSGTTLRAAADLKRNGIGYELIPEIAAEALASLRTYQTKPF